MSSLVLSFLYGPTLTSIQDYWKNHSFDKWTFVGKVISLLINMLSRFVLAFLPRSKRLLTSWLQSPSAVIFRAQENKGFHCFHRFPIYLLWSDMTGCHDLHCLNVEFQYSFFILFFHFRQEILYFLFTFCQKSGCHLHFWGYYNSLCSPSLFFHSTNIVCLRHARCYS